MREHTILLFLMLVLKLNGFDRREFSQMVGQPRHPRLVAPEFLALAPQFDRHPRRPLPLMVQVHGDGRDCLAVADQELVIRRAEGAQRRDEARGLEQVGLSLAIRPGAFATVWLWRRRKSCLPIQTVLVRLLLVSVPETT